MRLSHTTLHALSDDVARPAVSYGATRRIVHLGIGAFHRAHQAVYTQVANDAGDAWRITGVSLRSAAVRDTLVPQDGLYTVTQRANGAGTTRLIDVIDGVLVAAEDPGAVIAALADSDTHVVTLTVTEKGYHRDPAGGSLLLDDPAIASDLLGGAPRTIYGYIAAALARRREEGSAALTIVSCDNLPANGTLLMTLLTTFLDRIDPDLAAWTRRTVAAPDTMVDRIVPAASDRDRADVAAAIGLEDSAAIVTEPFSQWVIANRFAGPRPRWETAGAQIVADVAPFELAKLRLLNASHSALAYAGLQLGHAYVHQAIADPLLRAFVVAQMRDEAVPCLVAAAGLDPEAYIAAILDRFANADLHHRLDQIAMDGSQKLPQRLLATVAERLARRLDSPLHLTAIAAWIGYTAAAPAIADDPLRLRYAAIWAEEAGDSAGVVARFVAELGLFPESIRRSASTIRTIADTVAAWRIDGPGRILDAALSGRAA